MKNVARRHHFVPQGYLAGFTNDAIARERPSALPFSSASRNNWDRNVRVLQVDFNRVDLEGRPPDYLEQAMGEFEGKAISASAAFKRVGGL